MQLTISKSQFKPKSLEYLRLVEEKNQIITITHNGQPVVQIMPYQKRIQDARALLRGSVISYKRPYDPVGLEDWEALK